MRIFLEIFSRINKKFRSPKTPGCLVRTGDPDRHPENRSSFGLLLLKSPALKGYQRSSIQTAQYWPVHLFAKLSVSASGVILPFPQKNWPENPLNRPVRCRKRCNPGLFRDRIEWTQERSSTRLCRDGLDKRNPQNRFSFSFDRATYPDPVSFASQ